jgi:hypothetical protein
MLFNLEDRHYQHFGGPDISIFSVEVLYAENGRHQVPPKLS